MKGYLSYIYTSAPQSRTLDLPPTAHSAPARLRGHRKPPEIQNNQGKRPAGLARLVVYFLVRLYLQDSPLGGSGRQPRTFGVLPGPLGSDLAGSCLALTALTTLAAAGGSLRLGLIQSKPTGGEEVVGPSPPIPPTPAPTSPLTPPTRSPPPPPCTRPLLLHPPPQPFSKVDQSHRQWKDKYGQCCLYWRGDLMERSGWFPISSRAWLSALPTS